MTTTPTNDAAWRNRIIGHGEERAEDLVPHPQNWRKHPKAQAARLSQSLGGVGWVQDVIVNKTTGRLLDGHLRAEMAREQGVGTMVPVVYVALSEDEERAVLASLDPIAGMAVADEATLVALVGSIEDDDLRNAADDIVKALGIQPEPPPIKDARAQMERAEELRAKWETETGDLWRLGEHLLICGDCTDPAVLSRLMGGERARLLCTSPPYWIGKEYEIQKSEAEIDAFILACVRAWTDFVGVDYGRICINTGSAAIHRIEKRRRVEVLPLIDKWQAALRQRGWIARHWRIWAKGGGMRYSSISPKTDAVDQHWEHIVTFDHDEFSFLGTWWAPAGEQRGQQKIGTPWAQQGIWTDIHGEMSAGGHSAAFPLEIPLRNIMLYSEPGEVVLEPFNGSGTTVIACENLGRTCRAVEISPAYVAVALERWTMATGIEPQRVGADDLAIPL